MLPKELTSSKNNLQLAVLVTAAKQMIRFAIQNALKIFGYGLIALIVGCGLGLGAQLAQIWLSKHSDQQQPAGRAFIEMLTCYYAHPMQLYGTPQETKDVQLLESLGFHVINPNVPEYKTKDMAYFCDLAAKADLVAFRSLPDGKISPGVALELKRARQVLELPNDTERRSENAK